MPEPQARKPLLDAALERHRLQAAVAARQELGEEYEPALIEAFLERIEEQVADRLAVIDRPTGEPAVQGDQNAGYRAMVLGFVSLGTGIPITAVAGGVADLPGVIVSWAGIVGVNVAHALASRRR